MPVFFGLEARFALQALYRRQIGGDGIVEMQKIAVQLVDDIVVGHFVFF